MALVRGAMIVVGAWSIAVLAAACGEDITMVMPIIDTPENADAVADKLDAITLSVGHNGSTEDLDAHNFTRGQALELPGVPFGDDLVIHMEGLMGLNTTVSYGQTCPISVTPNTPPPQPHLYFSRLVKFGTVRTDTTPRQRRGGFGLSYLGGAVFVGGVTNGNSVVSVDAPVPEIERYDPLTNQVTTVASIADHEQGAAALLGDGARVVVLGGTSVGADLIDFLDGDTVNRTDFPGGGRANLTATSLVDGRVLVVGGRTGEGGAEVPSSEIDEISLQPVVAKLNVDLLHARSRHTATRFGNDIGAPVLIVGGLGPDKLPIAEAELFKPLSDTLADTFHAALQIPRYGHLAVLLPDESVLIIGGITANNQPVRTLERFTFDAGFFTVADLPADAGLIDAVATPLPDGRILLTGGRATPNGSPLSSVYILRFDPNDGHIDTIVTDRLAFARAGHQAALLCDGTILISGGTPDSSKLERYNPPPIGRP